MTRTHADVADAIEQQRPRRSVAAFVGSTLLNIAAVGGVICIILVILAYCFNITLIMFKTGSMSPTIPTGSLALVREIPASEIAVGDVVTVDRAGKLPVTHRVTSVSGDGVSDTQRTITLKGDANVSEDPAPYVVSQVRIVLASVPGLAYVVIWFSNPWVLAGLTLGCSALVMWAFWPRSGRKRPPGGAGGSDAGPIGGSARPPRDVRAVAGPPRHAALRRVAVASALGIGLAATGVAAPASAAPQVTVVTGDQLVLTVISDPSAMKNLTPGVSEPWEVGISTLPDATRGSIDVGVTASGSNALGLVMVVDSCTERWSGALCAGTSTRLFNQAPIPVDGVERVLLTMESEEAHWVRFDVTMPASTEVVDAPISLTVTANGIGDDVSASPGPIASLPRTGADIEFAVWAAAGAIMLGLAGAWIGALRKRSQLLKSSR